VLDSATDAVANVSASGASITRNDVQLHSRRQHLEQPTAIVTEGVVELVVGPAMYASNDIDI
jgi:hypothetical protein